MGKSGHYPKDPENLSAEVKTIKNSKSSLLSTRDVDELDGNVRTLPLSCEKPDSLIDFSAKEETTKSNK
eukprot:14859128-Ditylum_brightwellii.AAC.1